jgi:hypothetical protein
MAVNQNRAFSIILARIGLSHQKQAIDRGGYFI